VATRLLETNVIPGGASGVVADRRLLVDLGGFDETLGTLADWDLWIRLAMASPVAVVPEATVGYRTHRRAMSRSVDRLRQELEVLREKYRPEREERGVEISEAARERYYAELHHRQGRRIEAARSHFALARRHGQRRGFTWTPLALAWPGSIRLRDRRYLRRAPDGWVEAADDWLAPLREYESRSPGVERAGNVTPRLGVLANSQRLTSYRNE